MSFLLFQGIEAMAGTTLTGEQGIVQGKNFITLQNHEFSLLYQVAEDAAGEFAGSGTCGCADGALRDFLADVFL